MPKLWIDILSIGSSVLEIDRGAKPELQVTPRAGASRTTNIDDCQGW
jgi:hypothetical protein